MSINRKSCFIIMPFSRSSDKHTDDHWKNHYNFLKGLIESIGDLEVSRSEPLRGDIIKEIIVKLVNSDIVVADITDDNPNVYWELGVRQSFRFGTITISEYGTKPRFNISTKGIIHYHPENIYSNEEFRNTMKKALMDCIENPDKSDSIVLDTIPSRDFNPLPPNIAYNILPVYVDKGKPRTGFVMSNLSHQPAKVVVTIKAYLGKVFQTVIKSAYYNGRPPWNLNPNDNVSGNFPLDQSWLENKERLTLELHVVVFDRNDSPHKRLPTCYTYVRDRNIWNYEPTSFDELKQFKI